MSLPKKLIIKESLAELRKLQKSSIPMISARIRALIEFKKHESTGISKRAVAEIIGANHNSVQTWRSLYISGGLEAVLNYEKRDGRPSVFTAEEHIKIEKLLHNPQNGITGFVELLDWVEKEFGKSFQYNTLFKYAQRHFGAKVKVARKSHIKKDSGAVEDFKKTSDENVPKSPTE